MKTDNFYTYDKMKKDAFLLKKEFSFLDLKKIGKSVWGRPLFYIKAGVGRKKVLFVSCHHGMEHLTSKLVLTFLENYIKKVLNGEKIAGFDARELYFSSSLYVVPMLNPDGADLSVFGLLAKDITNLSFLKSLGISDFSSWQANANGVDLNHNYDAFWEKGKEMEKSLLINGPGPTRFSGVSPETEPEVKALLNLTKKEKFDLVIAFHSQGKEIYYDFFDYQPKESLYLAEEFEKLSGYKVKKPSGMASFGGFKDWFIKEYKKMGFTIEIGEGENPLFLSDLDSVYKDTEPIMARALFSKE